MNFEGSVQGYDPESNTLYLPHEGDYLPQVLSSISPGILELHNQYNAENYGIKNYVKRIFKDNQNEDVYYSFTDGYRQPFPNLALSPEAAQTLLQDPDVETYLGDPSTNYLAKLKVIAGKESEINFPNFMDDEARAEEITRMQAEVLRTWPGIDANITGESMRTFADTLARKIYGIDKQEEDTRSIVHETQHYYTNMAHHPEITKKIFECDRNLRDLLEEDESLLASKEKLQIEGEGTIFSAFYEAISLSHEIFGSDKIESLENFNGDFLIPKLADVLRSYTIDPGSTEEEPAIIDLLRKIYSGEPIPRGFGHRIGTLMILLPGKFIDFSKPGFLNWDILIQDESSSTVRDLSLEEKVNAAMINIYNILVESSGNTQSVGESLLESKKEELFVKGYEKAQEQLAKSLLYVYEALKPHFPPEFEMTEVENFVNKEMQPMGN
jgi:hypothetical protein